MLNGVDYRNSNWLRDMPGRGSPITIERRGLSGSQGEMKGDFGLEFIVSACNCEK